jgi:hypothetical protein
MASPLASALETTGGESISCGFRTACETYHTSLAASSKFIQIKFYSDVTASCALDEVTFRIPSIELIAFSNGSVIW